MAKLEASRSGADEVVLLDQQGFLTEGRSANLFLVRRGKLFTPAEGVLAGITRETIFEIADAESIPAAQAFLTAYDLYSADEAFLCTTAGGIFPIARADGRAIGSVVPGPITRLVDDRYWQRHLDGPDTTPVFAESPATAR
jgi:branched-chain amino acid aminotransferase